MIKIENCETNQKKILKKLQKSNSLDFSKINSVFEKISFSDYCRKIICVCEKYNIELVYLKTPAETFPYGKDKLYETRSHFHKMYEGDVEDFVKHIDECLDKDFRECREMSDKARGENKRIVCFLHVPLLVMQGDKDTLFGISFDRAML